MGTFAKNIFFIGILSSCLLLGACFWPQSFNAEIKINSDGTFEAKYNGELVQSKDEPLAFILLSENSNFTKFNSVSNFIKTVSYQESGSVISETYKFPPKVEAQGGSHFFEILRYDNGNISLHGYMNEYEQGREEVEKNTNNSYQLTGTLKISVEGDIVFHNADRVNKNNEFIWIYDDPSKPKNPELIVGCADRGQNFCVGSTNSSIEGLFFDG